jgi:hypothetical protein
LDAERRFRELSEAGYTAAKRTANGMSEVIRQFDPTVKETLFTHDPAVVDAEAGLAHRCSELGGGHLRFLDERHGAIPTLMPPTSRAGAGPAPHANDRCLLG